MADTRQNPALTYTLDDFVAMQIVDDMTYYNFSILEVIDKVEHLSINLVEEYLEELKMLAVTVVLSDEEFNKYKYNPDLLAFDLYKSVQLDFVILLLNDMYDPKEFAKKSLKLVYTSDLSVFLSSVYSKEYGWIQQNRADNNLLI